MREIDGLAITDADDPRIAPYRDIREKDLVGRAGHFIAEGEVVLRVLARARHLRTLSILIVEKRLEALRPLLADFPRDVPVYLATQDVVDCIAGFSIHRGILALGARGPGPDFAHFFAALPAVARVVVLFGIANHDNMGGIYRNAAAFGAAGVILDGQCCDPLYRKAIRVSVGATLIVPTFRVEDGQRTMASLRTHGFALYALSPRGTINLRDVTPPARAALLLGTEGPGLPDAVLQAVQTVSIPMAAGFDSLNVATASGIALHHFGHVEAED